MRMPTYYEIRCRQCQRLVEVIRDTAPVADVIEELRKIHEGTGTMCVVDLPTLTLHLNTEVMAGKSCRCRRAWLN